jgi:hypothetical protein
LSAKNIPTPDPKLPDGFISNAMAIVFRFAGSQTQSPAVSALAQKPHNNFFEICTSKNKELKTYCNQHLQKNGGGVAHISLSWQRLSESVSRPDEAAGDVI